MSDFPTLAGFKFQRLLGKGGMATVYLALQESLHREVAIKVMAHSNDHEFLQRFLNEGRLIASINHPNVITVFDVGQLDDGRSYIAMEYVEGGDLEEKLQKEKISVQDALKMIRQAAECLNVVHQKGIIHRDLKPANFLFRDNGTLVVTDFGVAKQLDEVDVKLTQDGHTMGSPAYTSPEQAQCHEVDGRTDIYSLGVVLAEMLLGYNPFLADTYLDTTLNHVTGEIPQLPPAYEKVQPLLAKMLQKAPQQRFSDMQQLIDAIDALLAAGGLDVAPEDMEATQMMPGVIKPSADALAQNNTVLSNSADLPTARSSAQIDSQPQNAASAASQADALIASKKQGGGLAKILALLVLLLVMAVAGAAYLLHDSRFAEQFTRAETLLAAEKLIGPEEPNAESVYRQILVEEPENGKAKRGLEKIADKLLEIAETRRLQWEISVPENDSALFYLSEATRLGLSESRQARFKALLAKQYLSRAEERLAEWKIAAPSEDSAFYYLEKAASLGLSVEQQNAFKQQVALAYLKRAEQSMAEWKITSPKDDSVLSNLEKASKYGLPEKKRIAFMDDLVRQLLGRAEARQKAGSYFEPAKDCAAVYYRLIARIAPEHKAGQSRQKGFLDDVASRAEEMFEAQQYEEALDFAKQGLKLDKSHEKLSAVYQQLSESYSNLPKKKKKKNHLKFLDNLRDKLIGEDG